MNYETKEAVQQIQSSPRTADEQRLAADLLAWREIAEKLNLAVINYRTTLRRQVIMESTAEDVKAAAKDLNAALAAYDKAVGK